MKLPFLAPTFKEHDCLHSLNEKKVQQTENQ